MISETEESFRDAPIVLDFREIDQAVQSETKTEADLLVTTLKIVKEGR